jgi:hypothetical protein
LCENAKQLWLKAKSQEPKAKNLQFLYAAISGRNDEEREK